MAKCKEKCEVYSRVTGYFRPVANWNRGKQEEFAERKPFEVQGFKGSRVQGSRTVAAGSISACPARPAVLAAALLVCVLIAGCGATARKMTESASGKNLGLDGYVMLGEIETANPETATPQGKLIIGRVTYKSRKVGIPADQKVPTTGYFKATKTESLFGTRETIIEYDFTAGSDVDAEKALQALQEKQKQAKEAFAKNEKKEEAAAAPPSDPVVK